MIAINTESTIVKVETQPILTQDESASLPSLSKVNERKVPQNEEFEMEITGDMLEFLKKSMKHKKERGNDE